MTTRTSPASCPVAATVSGHDTARPLVEISHCPDGAPAPYLRADAVDLADRETWPRMVSDADLVAGKLPTHVGRVRLVLPAPYGDAVGVVLDFYDVRALRALGQALLDAAQRHGTMHDPSAVREAAGTAGWEFAVVVATPDTAGPRRVYSTDEERFAYPNSADAHLAEVRDGDTSLGESAARVVVLDRGKLLGEWSDGGRCYDGRNVLERIGKDCGWELAPPDEPPF